MSQPLTKSQQLLRGKRVADMNEDELRDWIDACNKMENWVKHKKARRSWTASREAAEERWATMFPDSN
jgi:hypothetical protein